jgi:hypothetical protein
MYILRCVLLYVFMYVCMYVYNAKYVCMYLILHLYLYICVFIYVHIYIYVKVKHIVHPITGHNSPEVDKIYNSSLSLTSALDGVGWSTPPPGRLTPGMTRCPLYRRLRVPQARSGQVRKTSPPPGFDPRTVQPVLSRYTY